MHGLRGSAFSASESHFLCNSQGFARLPLSPASTFELFPLHLLTWGDIQVLFQLVTSWGLWATCVRVGMCACTGMCVYTRRCACV